MLIEKEIISPGNYWYINESTGLPQVLNANSEMTKYWHGEGNKMLAAGLPIPVPYEHDFNAHPMTPKDKLLNNSGWIKEYILKDSPDPITKQPRKDVLFGILDIQDDNIAKKLPTTIRWTSPWINSFTDGSGKQWNNVISHLALTTRPRITRQSPFPSIAAALSLANNDSSLKGVGDRGIYLSRAGLLDKKDDQYIARYPMAFSMLMTDGAPLSSHIGTHIASDLLHQGIRYGKDIFNQKHARDSKGKFTEKQNGHTYAAGEHSAVVHAMQSNHYTDKALHHATKAATNYESTGRAKHHKLAAEHHSKAINYHSGHDKDEEYEGHSTIGHKALKVVEAVVNPVNAIARWAHESKNGWSHGDLIKAHTKARAAHEKAAQSYEGDKKMSVDNDVDAALGGDKPFPKKKSEGKGKEGSSDKPDPLDKNSNGIPDDVEEGDDDNDEFDMEKLKGPGDVEEGEDKAGGMGGDLKMEEILCHLLQALGVPMPDNSNPNEFHRHLYEAAMSKIKELTSEGMGKEKFKPDQNKPPNQQPNSSQPKNPLMGQVQQEQQPMYMGLNMSTTMSLEDLNLIADPVVKQIALSMYTENQNLQAKLSANEKTTNSLRDAKLKEANATRQQRVNMLSKLSPKVKDDLATMIAAPSMALSMGDAGDVIDPMEMTLKVLENGLAGIPKLLAMDTTLLHVQPQPQDADRMTPEREDELADVFARQMGCSPLPKKAS